MVKSIVFAFVLISLTCFSQKDSLVTSDGTLKITIYHDRVNNSHEHKFSIKLSNLTNDDDIYISNQRDKSSSSKYIDMDVDSLAMFFRFGVLSSLINYSYSDSILLEPIKPHESIYLYTKNKQFSLKKDFLILLEYDYVLSMGKIQNNIIAKKDYYESYIKSRLIISNIW